MQNGDVVRISYLGKVKGLDQEIDRGENVPIVVGAGNVIPGIEEALRIMNLGEKRAVEISPDNAFGPRHVDLMKIVPLSEFRRHGTDPQPGMAVEADNRRGRVMSISGGRVKVDFNHPMAGKTLLYEIEIREKIEEPKQKAIAIIEFYTKGDNIEVRINEKEMEITLPHMVSAMHVVFKKKIADEIMKFLGFERVKFSEVFEKPKKDLAEKN